MEDYYNPAKRANLSQPFGDRSDPPKSGEPEIPGVFFFPLLMDELNTRNPADDFPFAS